MGTVIAWVLVRDRFWGKRVLDVVIDVPFALPTIVAGLVLLVALRPAAARSASTGPTPERAVFLALAFVTLPFVVRTVQPVLEELEADVEEAAASLGASRLTIFRRIILPSLVPAIAAGAALSLRPGDLASTARWCCSAATCPFQTEVVSVRVLTFIENGNTRRGRRGRLGDARGRAGRDRRARHRPEEGGPPWLRSPPPSSWVLRLLAVGYVFFLVAWPVALVVQQHLRGRARHAARRARATRDVVRRAAADRRGRRSGRC